MSVDSLPPVVTLAQAWRARPESVVARARQTRGPRLCQAALAFLGATKERVALYVEVVGKEQALEPREAHWDALEIVAGQAEIAVEESPEEWGRVTVDDVLAGWTVAVQHPVDRATGTGEMSYWGWEATRHWWALAAAGVTAVDLARRDEPVRFEDLALLAALRGMRMPPLAPGEVFDPPTVVFLEPVQGILRLEGRWWAGRQAKGTGG